MPEGSESPSAAKPGSIEKLTSAVDRLSDEVRSVDGHVQQFGTELATTREAVVDLRKDHGSMELRLGKVEGRAAASERNLKRHDSGFRRISETDLKIQSDQAAHVVAIEEARTYAKKAAEDS